MVRVCGDSATRTGKLRYMVVAASLASSCMIRIVNCHRTDDCAPREKQYISTAV
jgi:hypothetical protein